MKARRQISPPQCPYCGDGSVFLESSKEIYHGQDYGPVWICRPCQAWVGCHPNGAPLGRLADIHLRRAKQDAHSQFDVLWSYKARKFSLNKQHARGKAYKWLAGELGIAIKDCHIGLFDIPTCNRVADICRPYVARLPVGERHTRI